MRFRTPIIMLVAAVLLIVALAACQPARTPAPEKPAESEAGESEAAAAAPKATAVPATNEAVSEVSMNGPDGCMAFSAIPEPNPTLEALFPPPGADDHTNGPAEASVVITEYSDFQ